MFSFYIDRLFFSLSCVFLFICISEFLVTFPFSVTFCFSAVMVFSRVLFPFCAIWTPYLHVRAARRPIEGHTTVSE